MDFRAHQDQAKTNSKKIWILFIFLLFVSSALTGLMVSAIIFLDQPHLIFTDEYFLLSQYISIVAFVILVLSTITGFARNSNGASVARHFNGVLLTVEGVRDPYNSSKITRKLTLNEKRCLNIVEEKSLAASIEPPPLYLIPDPALNAFAAGNNKDNAVIGITEGSLETFNRDELEGIISHELGHIVTEDVKLNIRVAALVFGFSAFLVLGRLALYSSRGSRQKGIIILIAIALMLIGAITVVFGRILQAAMSRQREYLADASAIQFTRNPNGLVSAFSKIESMEAVSTEIESQETHEYSHAFIFGLTSDTFATHPPLKERIKRISKYL